MTSIHVFLQEWPADQGPGGRVVPVEDPLKYWVVTRVWATYEAPDGIHRGQDPWGRPIEPEILRAYLVDLDGSHELDLAGMERVLLHRIPRHPHWWIKEVDGAYLARIEAYKVAQ
ncbi:hypothetical protein [Nonomuraea typhae]|uniref:Uncharacterized protein n=1 Tax=Nonomuraea typhae TaxID=2603600 RepID=A0ABW7YLW5_9ACTN